jgi:hypothetical protein
VSCGCFCADGVQNARGIDERGSSVHRDGNAERFRDLFSGGSRFQCRVGVNDDAPVAVCGDCNGKRDELARFLIEFARCGGAQSLIATHGVWIKPFQLAKSGENLFLVFIPIEHHKQNSFSSISINGRGLRKYSATSLGR